MHWLEYLSSGTFSVKLEVLRQYLANSPVQGERKPTRHGRMAVLDCDGAVAATAHLAKVFFRHEPRVANVAPGVSVGSQPFTVGVDRDAAATAGLVLDPHAGLYSMPSEAAHGLAFQDALVTAVVYSEPGLL